jgi:SAM-dependent methyltransferase
MGVTPACFDFLLSAMPYEIPWYGLRMLELGNQHFHDNESHLMERDGSHIVKAWFEKRGVEHVSIDTNGQDGALRRDICADLSDLGQFDIVTNFGSSEHVDDQAKCWQAFDTLCRPGGVMVHAVPLIGHWPHHCRFRYSKGFFEELVRLNGYRKLHLSFDEHCGRDRNLIFAAMMKRSKNAFFASPMIDDDTCCC